MEDHKAESDSLAEARRNLDVAQHTYWEGLGAQPSFAQTALLASIAESLIVIAEALSTSPEGTGP